MSLKIEKTVLGGKIQLKFAGRIDEDADFTSAQVSAAADEICLDVDGITGLNSCGTREWIRWMDTVPPSVKISIVLCPKALLDQINMVEGLVPARCFIQSVYVPFFCEKCSHLSSVLFTSEKELVPGTTPEKNDVSCEKCGSAMEMDVMPNRYFKFLRAKTAS